MVVLDENKIRAGIPSLRGFVEELIRLVRGRLDSPIRHSDGDHLGFMSLAFVSKQVEHLVSIKLLIENGRGADARLIARSMMEGMCQLLWAAHNSSSRPLIWREYTYVEDFRLMAEQETSGEQIDGKRRESIEQFLSSHGDQFLTKAARRARSEGRPLPPDPYCHQWHRRPIREMFNEVRGELLYERLYRQMSGWGHWSPWALGQVIRRVDNRVHYSTDSPRFAATALAVGFQSLLQCVELLNRHLSLDMGAELDGLKGRYIDWSES